MKHLVFMKLIPGAFDDAAERDYRETFAALQSALPDDILAVSVRKNCVARAQNMDVLVEMTPEHFSDSLAEITQREKSLVAALKAMLGIFAQVHLVSPKSIARSEGKAIRVIDKRRI